MVALRGALSSSSPSDGSLADALRSLLLETILGLLSSLERSTRLSGGGVTRDVLFSEEEEDTEDEATLDDDNDEAEIATAFLLYGDGASWGTRRRLQSGYPTRGVGGIVFQWSVVAFLVMMSGLFSGLTLGLLSLDKTSLEIVIGGGTEEEKQWARKVLPVREDGNRLLCTLLLGNVIVNSGLSIFLSNLTSSLSGLFLSTALIVIFGEILPQATCSRHALKIGARTVPIVRVFLILLAPVTIPLAKALDCILDREVGTVHTRKEIYEYMKVHVQRGELDKESGDVMRGALEMKEKPVADVMTPLEDVYMLPDSTRLNFKSVRDIFEHGFSRVPVFRDHRQNIVGLLFVKDLIFVDPEDETPLSSLLSIFHRGLHLVDETNTLDDVLRIFKRGHGHLALVRAARRSPRGTRRLRAAPLTEPPRGPPTFADQHPHSTSYSYSQGQQQQQQQHQNASNNGSAQERRPSFSLSSSSQRQPPHYLDNAPVSSSQQHQKSFDRSAGGSTAQNPPSDDSGPGNGAGPSPTGGAASVMEMVVRRTKQVLLGESPDSSASHRSLSQHTARDGDTLEHQPTSDNTKENDAAQRRQTRGADENENNNERNGLTSSSPHPEKQTPTSQTQTQTTREETVEEASRGGGNLAATQTHNNTNQHALNRDAHLLPQNVSQLSLLPFGDEEPCKGEEIVGIVTLEDIVEEIIGDEIIDETDVFVDVDNHVRVQGRSKFDFTKLRRLDADFIDEHLSPEEVKAVTAHLLTNVAQLNGSESSSSSGLGGGANNTMAVGSSASLKKTTSTKLTKDEMTSLVRRSRVVDRKRVSKAHAEKPHHKDVVYSRGAKSTFATLVLNGKLTVLAGKDQFRSEAGPWTVLGADALLADDDRDQPFIPDFSAHIATDTARLVVIQRDDYARAFSSHSLVSSNGGGNNNDAVLSDNAAVVNLNGAGMSSSSASALNPQSGGHHAGGNGSVGNAAADTGGGPPHGAVSFNNPSGAPGGFSSTATAATASSQHPHHHHHPGRSMSAFRGRSLYLDVGRPRRGDRDFRGVSAGGDLSPPPPPPAPGEAAHSDDEQHQKRAQLRRSKQMMAVSRQESSIRRSELAERRRRLAAVSGGPKRAFNKETVDALLAHESRGLAVGDFPRRHELATPPSTDVHSSERAGDLVASAPADAASRCGGGAGRRKADSDFAYDHHDQATLCARSTHSAGAASDAGSDVS